MSSESSGSPKDYFARLNDKLQIDDDKLVNQIHDNAEKFDEQTANDERENVVRKIAMPTANSNRYTKL